MKGMILKNMTFFYTACILENPYGTTTLKNDRIGFFQKLQPCN